MYGNTAVHQAAASGNIKVLQCYLSRGVDVDMKNARGHTPLELTTEPETKSLITRAGKTEKCDACKSKFDFKNIRYYCESSQKFYCKNCSITTWVYENYESAEKERPVCRSKAVQKKIKDHENKLAEAVEAYEFHTIDKALRLCSGIDIDVKLKRKATVLHEKLWHEL
jgi:transposase-like protein